MHRLAAAVCLLVSSVLPAAAADWPMWRCDAQHSGATDLELPAALHRHSVTSVTVGPR